MDVFDNSHRGVTAVLELASILTARTWLDRIGLTEIRTVEDVLDDLSDDQKLAVPKPRQLKHQSFRNGNEPASKYLCAVIAAIIFAIRLAFGIPSLAGCLSTGLISICLGYLLSRMALRNVQRTRMRRLEFFLPIVMERIVMAVQAGHDILSALHAVIDQQREGQSKSRETLDPVTLLLSEILLLVESGLSFEQSLSDYARRVPCIAVRHAFIHLAQAHKEGGELIVPLRELSDATQLYYQESIEEEIAKLPVKATAPLLCTFAGLVLFFLTAPLFQVMEITTKAMPK